VIDVVVIPIVDGVQRWLSKVLADRGVSITTEVLPKLGQTCPAAPLGTHYRPQV
jgi:hypothetical protein